MKRQLVANSLTALLITVLAIHPTAAQSDAPPTSWGDPDLQGVWDYRTITPLQRPDGAGEFLTDEAARKLEEAAVVRLYTDLPPLPGSTGSHNRFWVDRGTSVISTNRTSLIFDPPNGRIPALTSEAEKRQAEITKSRGDLPHHEPTPGGWLEDLGPDGLQARCLTGFNAGPPMTPGSYNNNMQVFQTQDTIVILNEMVHDARIIPLDRRLRISDRIQQWAGQSLGHWDGDTLVVTTTNFLRETSFLDGGSSADLQLTERFTRMSPETLLYRVTVDDPTTFSQPWTYEVPMQASDDPLYEYACHEGNYGMYNILVGAAMRDIEASKNSR